MGLKGLAGRGLLFLGSPVEMVRWQILDMGERVRWSGDGSCNWLWEEQCGSPHLQAKFGGISVGGSGLEQGGGINDSYRAAGDRSRVAGRVSTLF